MYPRNLLGVPLAFASLVAGSLLLPSATVPFPGKLLFPTKWDLSSLDMFLLTLAATGFILALTLAQGLIALKAYAQTAFSWIAAVLAFVVVVALGNDLFLRNELGFVAGSMVAAVLMAVQLFVRMHRAVNASVDDLVEVVEHEPLEI